MNKIYFQDALLKHIKEAGFPLAESILRTKEDELIVYDQDRVPYIVKSYFEGGLHITAHFFRNLQRQVKKIIIVFN